MNQSSTIQSQNAAKSPIWELLALAGPTVAQMASYTVMQFIDTWMLAHVHGSVTEPTAAANSGMISFAIISFGVGVLFLINTLVSQHYGAKEYRACGQYLWQGVWFSLFFAVLVLPALPFSQAIFHSLGHEPQLAKLESAYFQISIGLAILKLGGTTLGNFLLAVNRPGLVLASAVVGVSANALSAWILIFGNAGVPSMGVVGAAWAQGIGVGFELMTLIWFVSRPGITHTYHIADWRLQWVKLKVLLRLGLPSGLQLVSDVLAWSLFTMWVMAPFGTHAMAANTFMLRYMMVSFMPAIGLGTAVTALVGRYIGKGEPDMARQRADLGFLVAAIYMVCCGLFFYLGRHWLMGMFTEEPDVRRMGAVLLIFAAFYQFFDALYLLYIGALRGAGDTFVPAVMTALFCWTIAVGGGVLVAHYWPALGVAGPWIMATAYGITVGIFVFARFRSGAWRSIRLEDDPASDKVDGLKVPLPVE
ncbi:MAG: MATE family efflux transporter [Phycisphaerales bacterium]|jgi:MATE family multidrug resistance protein|nr:MATE family efflux transporter [Phycisphaerales bacterium]